MTEGKERYRSGGARYHQSVRLSKHERNSILREPTQNLSDDEFHLEMVLDVLRKSWQEAERIA